MMKRRTSTRALGLGSIVVLALGFISVPAQAQGSFEGFDPPPPGDDGPPVGHVDIPEIGRRNGGAPRGVDSGIFNRNGWGVFGVGIPSTRQSRTLFSGTGGGFFAPDVLEPNLFGIASPTPADVLRPIPSEPTAGLPVSTSIGGPVIPPSGTSGFDLSVSRAIPSPGAGLLFGSGLVIMGTRRRRR